MNPTRLRVAALILAGCWLAGSARADLLVAQAVGPAAGYRVVAEGELVCTIEAVEAALVLFFPPLNPPPPGDPQVDPDPPEDPPGPPDPPDDPPNNPPDDDPPDDDPPDDPPHDNPEPASLVSSVVGSGLVCLFGWWRRRPQLLPSLAAA
jgi:hypothetical protein